MYTKNDILTITQLLTLHDRVKDDKVEGKISDNRKVTVYKNTLRNTVCMEIKNL